jgi:NAD-dependent SIR2 family protein deacetylase
MESKHIPLRLPVELYDELKQEAESRRISMNAVVLECLGELSTVRCPTCGGAGRIQPPDPTFSPFWEDQAAS